MAVANTTNGSQRRNPAAGSDAKAAKKPLPVRSLCVYLGSNFGRRPEYERAALGFGELLARRGIALVYGGASNGCMGAVADAVINAGGEVHGVIPRSFADKELAHHTLTRLDVVETMHERKARMAELADAFVALPGGIGTLEELFEVWTWAQIGYHQKAVGIYNVAGFYDLLIEFLRGVAKEQFIREAHLDTILVDSDPTVLLDRIEAYVPVAVKKWISRQENERVWGADLDRFAAG